MEDDDRGRSKTIKALFVCADDHLAVEGEQRMEVTHDYVIKTWGIVLERFPEYAENPPFEFILGIFRGLIVDDGLWID